MITLYYNQERARVKNKEENKMENTYKLTGSEKQITWATDIINDIMNTLDKNIEINKERKIFLRIDKPGIRLQIGYRYLLWK